MEWIKIFPSETVARKAIQEQIPQLVIVGGRRICLALFEGEFFAVQDKCTHNGESLSKGRINYKGEIVYPFHGFRFDLNGGMACDSASHHLTTYPIKSDDSGFFIGL
jgi:nitrite reductase/ring-hydroxylating ferredoxin subunit